MDVEGQVIVEESNNWHDAVGQACLHQVLAMIELCFIDGDPTWPKGIIRVQHIGNESNGAPMAAILAMSCR